MKSRNCSSLKLEHSSTGILIVLFLILLSSSLLSVNSQTDSDNDGIHDSKESALLNLYAPILQFKSGENFFPVDIGYHLDNAVLKLRSDSDTSIIDLNPTLTVLPFYTNENYYLDNSLGNFSEILDNYNQNKDLRGYTVYGRVTQESSSIIVQYWFFYAYNDASINQHEGDWEMIMILLDNSENPVSAVYSQHSLGQRVLWGEVEKADSTHPIVYVARGSHANYFRPYQGTLGLENDEVGSDGESLTYTEITLVELGEQGAGNHPLSQNWLDFGGRWGEWAKLADASIGFAGPHGPGHVENSEKWHMSATWGQDIALVGNTWFILSWFAANFLYIYLAITVLLFSLKLRSVVKAKRKGRLRLSEILKSKASIGIVLGLIGLGLTVGGILLPWYNIQANIQTDIISTDGTVDLLVMDGVKGVQVNFLREGEEGLSPTFGLKIPFGILLLAGIITGTLDIIGVEKAKSLGSKYIRSGVIFSIILVILILFIFLLTSTLPYLASTLGTSLPPEAIEIAENVAQQPLKGEALYQTEDLGSVYLIWGLGMGAYLFIASALARILGGIILRSSSTPTKTVPSTTKQS